MDENLKNELIGRLWLWVHSIERTQALLQLAFRAKIGMNQQSQEDEMDNYWQKFNEYVRAQPDYKPEIILSSQRIAFDKSFHRVFPTLPECGGIYDTCIELAIVYFCQIFNKGFWKHRRSSSK